MLTDEFEGKSVYAGACKVANRIAFDLSQLIARSFQHFINETIHYFPGYLAYIYAYLGVFLTYFCNCMYIC